MPTGVLLALLSMVLVMTSVEAQTRRDPTVAWLLDNDPGYAEIWETLPDAEDPLAAQVELLVYVGENYPRDSSVYFFTLLLTASIVQAEDLDGRYDALIRTSIEEVLPLAEAIYEPGSSWLGTREIEELRYYNELWQGFAGEGNVIEEPRRLNSHDTASLLIEDWLDTEFMDEPIRSAIVDLREQREGLEGQALIANLRREVELQSEHNPGFWWGGSYHHQLAILDELSRSFLFEELETEAAQMVNAFAAEMGPGFTVTIAAGQYLAHALEWQGRGDEAIAVLEPMVFDPAANYSAPEFLFPLVGDPSQPEHRIPQARSQLARLLLEADDDPAGALEHARFATRYLTGFRSGRGFTSDIDQAIAQEFRAPDEPFGQDSREQFSNLVEAAWRVREAGNDNSEALFAEAFAGAQEALAEATTPAVARTAALALADAAGMEEQAREREAISEELPSLTGAERLQALARQQEIDLELLSAAPEFFSLIRPSALSLEEARELLEPGEALLLVLPTAYGTHALVVTTDSEAWHKSDWTADELGSRALKLRLDLDPWGAGSNGYWDGGFAADISYDLYREILAPVMPILEGSDTLLYATGPALSSIPLTVLTTQPSADPEARQHDYRAMSWLGDRFAMAQLPSLSSLAFLRASDDDTKASRSMVGFADPALEGGSATRGGRNAAAVGNGQITTLVGENEVILADSASIRALSRLPGTVDEVQMLADTLGQSGVELFLGLSATETAVKAEDLADVRYLVFATHGLLAGEAGIAREPGLVFTPPEEASAQDDGLLTASEILALDLSADWVILSACNTAAADGLGGGGLSGLARSFFYAGASSLLASHWPVRDDIAPLLTSGAVRLLEQNPDMSRAQALQRTMASVRNYASIEGADHPSSWAPFITVGELR